MKRTKPNVKKQTCHTGLRWVSTSKIRLEYFSRPLPKLPPPSSRTRRSLASQSWRWRRGWRRLLPHQATRTRERKQVTKINFCPLSFSVPLDSTTLVLVRAHSKAGVISTTYAFQSALVLNRDLLPLVWNLQILDINPSLVLYCFIWRKHQTKVPWMRF